MRDEADPYPRPFPHRVEKGGNMLTSIPLPLEELVPKAEFFDSASELHGRLHVARVMIHAFRLIRATGNEELEIPLWAATYIHDLGRTHDGYCEEHGRWSVEKLRRSPEIQRILMAGGMTRAHVAMVETAAIQHCLLREQDPNHPHYRLTALLKDADALDRVRLGDLDPSYLRHPEAREMVGFAEELFRRSGALSPTRPGIMAALWDAVK